MSIQAYLKTHGGFQIELVSAVRQAASLSSHLSLILVYLSGHLYWCPYCIFGVQF